MQHIVIIPAHNEEAFIGKTLESIVNQQTTPTKVIVVNDNSTDQTQRIVETFCKNHSFIQLINNKSSTQHLPGQKIINAFYTGYNSISQPYDIISKMDADLIFPSNYFKEINQAFEENKTIGICGGTAEIEKNGKWILEKVAHKDHVRGGLKSYRKECFETIGGLKPSMGWDTVDELLALYNKWEVKVLHHLAVKHLKLTTENYKAINAKNQAIAFYKMDYGFFISMLSILKAAHRKKSISFIIDATKGYLFAISNEKKIVTKKEGLFIRKYRWKKIFESINFINS